MKYLIIAVLFILSTNYGMAQLAKKPLVLYNGVTREIKAVDYIDPSTLNITSLLGVDSIAKTSGRDSFKIYSPYGVYYIPDSIGSGGGGGGGGTVYVDSLYKNSTKDSIVWKKNGLRYAIKDSIGLTSIDTNLIPNYFLKVRGLLSATSPLSYNNVTGNMTVDSATSTTNGTIKLYQTVTGNNTDGSVSQYILQNKFLSKIDRSQPIVATGTNTYACTITSSYTAYASGTQLLVEFVNANTGAATLNVNSIGTKPLKKSWGVELAAGDIVAGAVYLLYYNDTNFIITSTVTDFTAIYDSLNLSSHTTDELPEGSINKYFTGLEIDSTGIIGGADGNVLFQQGGVLLSNTSLNYDGVAGLQIGATPYSGTLYLSNDEGAFAQITTTPSCGVVTYLQLPCGNGSNNNVLKTNGSGVTTWDFVDSTMTTNLISSIYRKSASDSVFVYKNGVKSFAFRDSVGTVDTTTSVTGLVTDAKYRYGANTLSNKTISGSSNTLSNIGNSSLTNSTISGVALGGTLANLTATNSTLTFSGTYTGATARDIGINLGTSNTWTANTHITPTVSTGTGTTAGMNFLANSLTTGNGVDASSSSITTGNLMKLTSTSTAANAFSLLNIASSGANASSSRTATGQTISVTNTGTTSTNVGLSSSASGATNNYAALFPSGYVGIGTSAPTQALHIVQSSALTQFIMDSYNTSGSNRSLLFFRTATGTSGSPTDVVAGNQMGEFIGAGYAGGAFRNVVGMNFGVGTGTISSSSLPSYIYFEVTANGSVSRSEKMRLDQDGNLGLGATSQIYRTTNGGSDVSGKLLVDIGGSISTAGSKALAYDNTNQLMFTAANGTRRIARAGLAITIGSNSAGSENGNLDFYTKKATTAAASVMTIDSVGTLIVGAANNIKGTATNNNATAGNIGEYTSSLVASGSAVSLTTATTANVTSISLTAGDWDVVGNINYIGTTATVTGKIAGITSTSATMPTDGSEVYSGVQMTVVTATDGVSVSSKRFSISGTTTVYLVAQATFSAGTVTAFGGITARRVR